tara:strand:+ start:208 stop:669 length:462 start_codon:yes stop_codon:yes gene_type:complete
MININVLSEENAWSKKLKKKNLFFKDICNAFPAKYKFPKKKISFSVMLSNNTKIKKLNFFYRKKNKPTDILSFPSYDKLKISNKTYIGDIIISYNFINKPKSQNIKEFKKKLIKIFIHGFLHLLGFDHKKNSEYKEMYKEEEYIYKTVIKKLT